MSARTIVIGGGLAGLAAAHRLAARGERVELVEASRALGGVVGTVAKGGYLFERAPHTVLAGSPTFRRVVDELGLSPRLLRADPSARTRWLWRSGKLRALPSRPPELFTTDLLSRRAKLRVLSEPLRRFVAPDGGEPTLGAFLDERIGREAARLFAGAFVRGVHAAELDELGARSAFPRLWRLASEHGGIVRGVIAQQRAKRDALPGPDLPRTALVSFPRGLQELVDAFASALDDRARVGTRVAAIERIDARWLVRVADGTAHVADDVVIATSAPIAARLVEGALTRVDADTANDGGERRSRGEIAVRREPTSTSTVASHDGRDLDAIRTTAHASVTLVHLGFAPGVLDALPRGFGYLVPPIEDGRTTPAPRALGTIFLTNLDPNRAPRGARSVASFYRGTDVAHLDDDALARAAEADLALAIGSPVPRAAVVHVERWTEVIPRHAPGHADRVERVRALMRERARGLHVAGAWVGGVSVEQVLTSGRAAADDVMRRRQERP